MSNQETKVHHDSAAFGAGSRETWQPPASQPPAYSGQAPSYAGIPPSYPGQPNVPAPTVLLSQPGQFVPVGGVAMVSGTTVLSGGTTVVVSRNMGSQPSATTCPSCNMEIVTRVTAKVTTRTHVIAALLCLFACWPCVCIPYCMDSCKNAEHYCPNCSAYIGTYYN